MVPLQLSEAGKVHASLSRLLKATTTVKGPRVTLDEASLTLSTAASSHPQDDHHEARDEDEDERQLPPQDHSLFYRYNLAYLLTTSISHYTCKCVQCPKAE